MLYETLKFIHIVAAAVILGGGILMMTLLASAVFGRNGERMLSVTNIIAWVGPRLFAPAWALVMAFGIWTTLEGDLKFGDAWITIGFVVFAIGFALGPTAHQRNARQLTAAVAEEGPDSNRVFEIGKREFMVAAFEAALVIFAVWAMTARPGL